MTPFTFSSNPERRLPVHSSSELSDATVIVVGAGAVGSAVAYRLAQAGAAVTVIERNYPGAGTSGNSVAWLNAFGKFPKHYYRLSTQSIRDHRDLEWELDGSWLTLNGGVHWEAPDGHSQFGDLAQAIRLMRGWGARIETVPRDEFLRKFEPGLNPPDDEAETVYVVRDEGWLQPAPMIGTLVHRAVVYFGARMAIGTVQGLTGKPGQVDGVLLSTGERLCADLVIVAAGPESPRLAAMAGASLPVGTSTGVLAVTAPSPATIGRVIVAPDIILRPDAGGRVLFTSEALSSVAPDTIPSTESVEIKVLLERVRDLVPSLQSVPIEALRKGVRALPSDGYPIVGFDPQINGLYYAVMHSGITLCAGIANLVVSDLLDPSFDGLDPYRPGRFAEGATLHGPSGE